MHRKVTIALWCCCLIGGAAAARAAIDPAAALAAPDQSSGQTVQAQTTAPADAPESPAAPLLVIVPAGVVGAVWAARRHRAPPV